MPNSHAASISRSAWSSLSPWPKNSGAEPTPPKLPQPSATRETVMAERPSGRLVVSISLISRSCRECSSLAAPLRDALFRECGGALHGVCGAEDRRDDIALAGEGGRAIPVGRLDDDPLGCR